jgi:uncharacterized YceG family protein
VSDDWLTDDAFVDPDDPAARERAERREARERKRAEKVAKRSEAEPPPPPPEPAPPKPERTPEEEFWDEDPTPEPAPPSEAAAGDGAADRPAVNAERAAEEREMPAAEERETPAEREPAPGVPSDPNHPPTDPALEPVPVAADPTRPATGEHLVPDPSAPHARGQTSEEWAVVRPARTNALDDAFHDDGHPEMAGAARTGRRRDDGGSRRRGGALGPLTRHPFRIAAVIVLLVVLYLLNALFQPFHGDGHGHVAVRIPKGASVSEVGDLLEKRGVLAGPAIGPDASTLFQIRVTLAGKRSDLFAGHFVLQKDMSYGAAIDALTREPTPKEQAKPGVVTVTIPEGQSRPITAKLVREDGIKGDYLKATKKSKYLDPAEYGGKGARNLEGFLFPDTWEVKTKQPISHLVQLQLEDFKKKIKKVNMKYANSKNLTIFDVVTIASMVEREAGVPKQRKLVASVIYNRLHEGMTLGIDSTIRFATGNYEKPLTQSELESESPYNTRTHLGLPPGPINSPGLAAIQAAAHPAKTDYLFYVTDPSSCNELTFAKTEEEFLADAQKYEQAREKNGGNQPSTCGE